jgi:Fic family protein
MVHGFMQRHAITTPQKASSQLKLSEPTINAAFRHLQEIGIVKEITGKKRRRAYAYSAYLNLLIEGTEPKRTMAV